MRTKPLFIAITNQKGGVGKSTFTVVLASYLHYLKNKSVLVVDCDTPQYSLRGIREREKQIVNHVDFTYRKHLYITATTRLFKLRERAINALEKWSATTTDDKLSAVSSNARKVPSKGV